MRLLICAFLWLPVLHADNLDGDWVRVVDGCEDLAQSEIEKLPRSGGGNQVSRAEVLSFRGDKFRSQISAPARCQKDFTPTGPDIKLALSNCQAGVASGDVTFIENHGISLRETEVLGNNSWGDYYSDFDYQIIHDDVLFLRLRYSDWSCPNTTKRIYFLRVPAS